MATIHYNAYMFLVSTIYKTILDSLFPFSAAEKEMLSMRPEDALKLLPHAPDYSGLAFKSENMKSVFAYKDERVSKLIWHIKYKKSVHAVRIGGYALWAKLTTTTGSGNEVVVIPMPITSRRRKERGYNQCELLLDEIERLEKEVGERRFIFKKDILIRTHHAERQTLKRRAERVEDAKGVFGVNVDAVTEELKQMPVIIIDDVITTGSTLYEAIETIKKAGFTNVHGLSLAH